MVFKLAEALHGRREKELGPESMRHLERFLLLQKIDEKWKDHLHGMDQLRSGIGLRGYAQVDPKIAYKKEGFELFQAMIGSIQDEVTNLLYKVRLVTPEEEQRLLERMWQRSQPVAMGPAKTAQGPAAPMGVGVSANPGDDGGGIQAAPAEPPPPARRAAQEGAAAAQRAMQRQLEMREKAAMQASRQGGPAGPAKATKTVGRNDPCPCGSGKKYKKCCGQGQG
jgi:preprotein translocase subunit SecA